jgi:hypothetical protein
MKLAPILEVPFHDLFESPQPRRDSGKEEARRTIGDTDFARILDRAMQPTMRA